MKDTLAEDRADLDRAAGLLPDSRAIERETSDDLARYDARKRAGVIRKSKELAQRQRQAVRNIGERWRFGAKLVRDRNAIQRCPAECACVNCKLRDRIRALIQLYPGTAFRKSDFMFPRFARDIAQEFTDVKRARGRYRDVLAHERDRVLKRALEDIADRSTGALGAWR